MPTLIIAEKPSVARDIAAIVGANSSRRGYREGNGYLVSWCVGHLIEAASPVQYNPDWEKWRLETLPILPHPMQYVVTPRTANQFKTLRSLIERKDVDRLICATDAGREGEHIFRLVYQQTGCQKPWKRLWTSSLEPDAIRAALRCMKDGHAYDHLAEAAYCRQTADWLFGMNLTRLYTCLYGTRLNTGRVQSPTLAMIVQRQNAIESFQPVPYFILHARLADRFTLDARFDKEAEADAFLACPPEAMTIQQVEHEKKSVQPPRLFDLSSLQCEANTLLGYSACETLATMQILYESHLATYPRTDSRFITSDMRASVQDLFLTFQQTGLLPQTGTNLPDFDCLVQDEKVQDHPALLPTRELTPERLEQLPEPQRKLLLLLLYRLLEATSPPYQYFTTTVRAIHSHVEFTATVSTPWEDGWRQWRSDVRALLKCPEQEKTADPDLYHLQEGMQLPVTGLEKQQRLTKPPKPYTEATLLAAMETAGRSLKDQEMREAMRSKGLGTAATRAGIIDSLVKNGYITRSGRQLIPTEKARTYIAVLNDRLKDPILTAEWESKLSDIESGTGNAEAFLRDIESFLSSYISTTKTIYQSNAEQYSGIFSDDRRVRNAIGTCPLCGRDVMEHPKQYGCSGYRESGCRFVIWKSIAGKKISPQIASALLRQGHTGTLKGFQRKDGTTFDAPLVLKNGKVTFKSGGKDHVNEAH